MIASTFIFSNFLTSVRFIILNSICSLFYPQFCLKTLKLKLSSVFLTVCVLAACGGGSGNNDEEIVVIDAADEVVDVTGEVVDAADEVVDTADDVVDATDDVLIGRFIDSAVQGVVYTTDSISGVTNDEGEFS